MAVRVNTHAFQQTTIQSAKLGVLGMIVHQMSDDATYSASVVHGDIEVASFRLVVDKSFPNMQVNVDLARLGGKRGECCEDETKGGPYQLGSKGYLILYVSEGAGGLHVLLSKLGEHGKPTLVYDSRALATGDQFAATLLRPGMYEMVDELGKAKGKVTVAYPKVEKAPYRPGEPVKVSVAADAFKPPEVTLGAAQGMVFSIQTARSAIKISLTKADDGPVHKRPQVRWTNPRMKKG